MQSCTHIHAGARDPGCVYDFDGLSFIISLIRCSFLYVVHIFKFYLFVSRGIVRNSRNSQLSDGLRITQLVEHCNGICRVHAGFSLRFKKINHIADKACKCWALQARVQIGSNSLRRDINREQNTNLHQCLYLYCNNLELLSGCKWYFLEMKLCLKMRI